MESDKWSNVKKFIADLNLKAYEDEIVIKAQKTALEERKKDIETTTQNISNMKKKLQKTEEERQRSKEIKSRTYEEDMELRKTISTLKQLLQLVKEKNEASKNDMQQKVDKTRSQLEEAKTRYRSTIDEYASYERFEMEIASQIENINKLRTELGDLLKQIRKKQAEQNSKIVNLVKHIKAYQDISKLKFEYNIFRKEYKFLSQKQLTLTIQRRQSTRLLTKVEMTSTSNQSNILDTWRSKLFASLLSEKYRNEDSTKSEDTPVQLRKSNKAVDIKDNIVIPPRATKHPLKSLENGSVEANMIQPSPKIRKSIEQPTSPKTKMFSKPLTSLNIDQPRRENVDKISFMFDSNNSTTLVNKTINDKFLDLNQQLKPSDKSQCSESRQISQQSSHNQDFQNISIDDQTHEQANTIIENPPQNKDVSESQQLATYAPNYQRVPENLCRFSKEMEFMTNTNSEKKENIFQLAEKSKYFPTSNVPNLIPSSTKQRSQYGVINFNENSQINNSFDEFKTPNLNRNINAIQKVIENSESVFSQGSFGNTPGNPEILNANNKSAMFQAITSDDDDNIFTHGSRQEMGFTTNSMMFDYTSRAKETQAMRFNFGATDYNQRSSSESPVRFFLSPPTPERDLSKDEIENNKASITKTIGFKFQ